MATNKISMLPLVVGIFLVILVWGSSAGREARPTYDRDRDTFQLSYVSSDRYAVAGDDYSIHVNVRNIASTEGTMWVQCSILDEDDHSGWLPDVGLQSTVTVGQTTRDNCVANEPFTQTARVTLSGNENEGVIFSVVAPDKVGKQNIDVYCDAFERCSSEGATYSTSSFRHPITIVEEAPDNSDDTDPLVPAQCVRDSDCKGTWLGTVECYNGQCLDKEDVPCAEGGDCPSKATDTAIKQWIMEHKIAVTGIALVLIIIGAFGIYRPSKGLGL